ncbi:MAG: hypothetical protein HQL20_10610 [Candidatus Omnitrophica bacterium]|nr:hypothetical protein [Candidatus Omnitrophota bacterium]
MKMPWWLTRQNIVFAFIGLAILWGIVGTVRELTALQAKRRAQPYAFGGEIFAGIKGATGSEKYLGYLTDRDINNDKVAMRFTQAQFTLAPLILDFNNPNHRLLILDFQDLKQAVALAEKMQLRLLKRSPQGLLFAERPGL